MGPEGAEAIRTECVVRLGNANEGPVLRCLPGTPVAGRPGPGHPNRPAM
jgi:hypothetical protein